MFADEILAEAKKKLCDFIVFESENIYSIDSSAATDTTKITDMSIEELVCMAKELETTYYRVLGKKN